MNTIQNFSQNTKVKSYFAVSQTELSKKNLQKFPCKKSLKFTLKKKVLHFQKLSYYRTA